MWELETTDLYSQAKYEFNFDVFNILSLELIFECMFDFGLV